MQISIANAIQVARRIGSAASIITNGLKMWLGFKTSEVIGSNEYDGNITTPINGGTFTDNGDGTFTVTGNGTPSIGVGVRDGNAEYLVVGNSYTFSASGSNTTLAAYDSSYVPIKSGVGSVTFVASTTSIKLYISPSDGITSTYSNVSVKEVTQFVMDKSPNKNNAKLFTGKALDFNGSTDSVDIDGFQLAGSDATFAFWVNPQRAVPNGFIFDANPSRFLIGFESNQISVFTGGSSWNNFGTIAVDTFSRIIITCSGTTLKCYVNGVQLGVAETAYSSFDLSSATETKIGSRYNAASSFFEGNLSDFQIYNAVWSADDIAYDYAKPNHLVTDNPSTSIIVTNLKAYWALSEGAGLVAYDSGTNLEADLILDGNFPLPNTNWNLRGTWTISDNKASLLSTSNQNYLSQEDVFTANTIKTYQLKFDAVVESGKVSAQIHEGGFFTKIEVTTTANNNTVVFTTLANVSGTLYFRPDSVLGVGFQGSITNVSVREVTPSDHGGLVIGATYTENEPRIPQLGMMDWAIGSNLYLNSEPTANESAAGDISYGSYSWGLNGFSNATIFGDNSVTRYRYGGSTTIGVEYTLSAFVIMDDNSEPDVTNLSNSGDFSLVVSGSVGVGVISKTNISENIWRVSKVKTAVDSTTSNGIVKYTTQSAKGFKVVGWQLEESSSVGNYILTDGAAAIDVTTIQNPSNKGYDIFGNPLRLREHAFNLDGSGYAEVADDASINPTTEITIQCWIKYNTDNDKGLVAKWTGTKKDYMLYKKTNKFVLYIGTTPLESGTLPSSGWVNIAYCTYNRFYY